MRQRICVDVIVSNLACCSLASHIHTAAVKVFLQMHLPKEYFPRGITATGTPPSSAGEVTLPATTVLQLQIRQESMCCV